jgi:ABC-type amino acid transport system permease subunit
MALAKVIVPQAKPIIFAGLGSYGIHLLKETALASLIGVVEIMNVANYVVERGANGLSVFLIAGLIYIILCLPIGGLAALLARSVRVKATADGQNVAVSR